MAQGISPHRSKHGSPVAFTRAWVLGLSLLLSGTPAAVSLAATLGESVVAVSSGPSEPIGPASLSPEARALYENAIVRATRTKASARSPQRRRALRAARAAAPARQGRATRKGRLATGAALAGAGAVATGAALAASVESNTGANPDANPDANGMAGANGTFPRDHATSESNVTADGGAPGGLVASAPEGGGSAAGQAGQPDPAAQGRGSDHRGAATGGGTLPPLVGGEYGFHAPQRFEGSPKSFVSLGATAPAYGIVVEKLHHRLTVFRLREDGTYEVVKTYRAITGKDPEDKKTVGDLRTPEGIYFVTGRIHDKKLPPKYGRAAFTLDYPNIFDQRRRKSGYGIWIHATDDPSRLKNPFDTEGCVVVSNEDLLDLEQFLAPFEVPVVITKEMTRVAGVDLETPRTKASEMIESWRQAWEGSDFSSYMEHYSKNFRSLGKSREGWDRYKRQISRVREGEIKVQLSEPKILAFEDQLLVVFHQDYRSKTHSDFGRKFLYLQWEGDRYRIIAEKWYREKKTSTAERIVKPLNKPM